MRLSSLAWRACVGSIVVAWVCACGPNRNNGFDVVTDTDQGNDVRSDIAADQPIGQDVVIPDGGGEDVVGTDTPVVHDTGVDVPPLPPTVDIVVPPAPADSNTRFGGSPDPARAPDIVYPSDGTIVPHNLRGLEIHFHSANNDLFEVSFRGVATVVRVYTTCISVGGGCVLTLDDTTFNTIARAAGSDGQVTLSIRGTAAAGGGGVGTSASRVLGITGTDIRGGIYYWRAGAGSINRFEFGLPGAHSEVFIPGNPLACVGCHVLSRDGTRITTGTFGFGSAGLGFLMQTLDATTRTQVGAQYQASFGSFSPDATRLLASNGAQMGLLDTSTGAVTTGLAIMNGTMPDWSPNGSRAVFVLPATTPPIGGTPGHSGASDLMLMDWDGTAFGTPRILLHTGGENNYYPGFSPDNGWIIFNRAPDASYNNIAAQLFAIQSAGGSPVHLVSADGTGSLGNSWPKWAPFVDSYQGEPIMWFTFTSRRDYGLRLVQQSQPADMRTAQLWMAAFRPNRAATDPSVPAFWLPFQSISEGNHIAQWTQTVRRQTCRTNGDCNAGESCQIIAAGGVCVGS